MLCSFAAYDIHTIPVNVHIGSSDVQREHCGQLINLSKEGESVHRRISFEEDKFLRSGCFTEFSMDTF